MLVWTPVKVRLGDLRPWERNPRRMRKEEAERLLRSWQALGQFATIAIGPDGEVYDGHQRLTALLNAYGPDYEVIALQSSRPLTTEERQRLTLYANNPAGEWVWDELATWPMDILAEGFGEAYLDRLQQEIEAASRAIGGIEPPDMPEPADEATSEMLEAGRITGSPAYYQPLSGLFYEPRMPEPPDIAAIMDLSDYRAALEEINRADISEEEAAFLRLAATRLIRFRYDLIAERYAHMPEEVQALYRRLALVIVDGEYAIERGWLRVMQTLSEAVIAINALGGPSADEEDDA